MDLQGIGRMPAGRELDALIAEQVMGWKWYEISTGWWLHDRPNGICGAYKRSVAGEIEVMNVSHYSTDIADAWDVIDEIQTWIGTDKDSLKGNNWVNRFWYEMLRAGMYTYCMDRKDAAVNICRAALKAVMEDDNG